MTVRTLHLVDLENLAGDPRASERDALAAYIDYLRERTGAPATSSTWR